MSINFDFWHGFATAYGLLLGLSGVLIVLLIV